MNVWPVRTAHGTPSPDGSGQGPYYTASLNLKVKVLDFVKSGGPEWTVGGTVFEMWLGLALGPNDRFEPSQTGLVGG